MTRSRVLSFMSAFGGPHRHQSGTAQDSGSSFQVVESQQQQQQKITPPSVNHNAAPVDNNSDPVAVVSEQPKQDRSTTRPSSMAFVYQPPIVDTTLPELLPIFTYLSNHSNKLYQEGYFLKLNDLDTQGRLCPDRHWVECFAQLVGTILTLWDATALDAAEQEGEVAPTFINLADASIKMIETLPTRNQAVTPLQNVLSISTAAKNRYLFHFNSLHSLTQWTAGIRLALFEHTSLLEAYTGSIIAGKGKMLNNIRTIMDRSRFKQEDWARVRFGAGTPWRRYWCVITPPDGKEYQRSQKSLKKRSAYDRTTPVLTGNVKFYESKKTKKAQPIATITNVYAAYAIYPQSNFLIDQSTLIKMEGQVTIHSQPQSTNEGFVFVMPEVHPAVSGLEMMLRYLFPVFDAFGLYGRPTRLIADTNNLKSIMFAFPRQKRSGYLDVLDVTRLIHTSGSQGWSEREWRTRLKEATARRMTSAPASRSSSLLRSGSRREVSPRSRSNTMREDSVHSRGFSGRPEFNQSADAIIETSEKPEDLSPENVPPPGHLRTASDTMFPRSQQKSYIASRLSMEDTPLGPPTHEKHPSHGSRPGSGDSDGRTSSDSDRQKSKNDSVELVSEALRPCSPPVPVAAPPAFIHSPGEIPQARPQTSPELRMANARMSNATLAQMADAGKLDAMITAVGWKDSGAAEPNEFSPVKATKADMSISAHTRRQESLHNNTLLPAYSPNPSTQLPRLDINKAINRKPLPSDPISPPGEPLAPDRSPVSPVPSLGSLRHAVDEDALNRIMPPTSATSFSPADDVREDDESVYDSDTASPDYASRKSTETKRSTISVSRTRMGVMKTVGDLPPKKEVVIGDAHYFTREQALSKNPNIPTVDFGPTMSYTPTTRRPSVSDPLNKVDHSRSGSDGTTGRRDKKHPAQNNVNPGQGEPRRNVPWQPGMATGRPESPGARLTPEQFVQQRAVTSHVVNPPVLLHRRGSSTPTVLRPASSGDWTTHSRHQSCSKDLPPRPHSRGASTIFNYADLSSHLSAREQEHVARVTGSPFFNLSSNNVKQPAPVHGGLLSAIDAREREKKGMKDGVSNQMVQQAIAQRQQHQHQQIYEAQQTQLYGAQQQAKGQSIYDLPLASRTWDTFSHFNHPVMGQSSDLSSNIAAPTRTAQPSNVYLPNQYAQQYPSR